MTPNYINSLQNSTFLVGSSSIVEDHDINLEFQHQFFSPSFKHQHDANSSSSSHHSFHFYFNPTQDQAGCNYHTELGNNGPQQQFDQENGSGVAFGGSYDCYQVENKVEKGLKISIGSNKEGKQQILGDEEASNKSAKWMTSKARMMHNKMKKSDHKKGGEREDSQKLPFNNNNNNHSLGSHNNDQESNCSSYNNNINTPIRVCADCNTTKTPLWRSGPKGPKSLCNACGIRQRKARRALAAAAAIAANATPLSSTHQTTPSPTKVKIKVNHQKEKSKNNYGINANSTVPFKKRCKLTTSNASLAVGSSSSDQEPAPVNRFEGFLINLRNKLDFDHGFPQDEKEAAMLLMALSCGLVHG